MSFESGRIAILGTGYVASAYARALHFLGLSPVILSRAWFDYTDMTQLAGLVRCARLQLIINAAGYTGKTVDDCEKNKDLCYQANVVFPRNLASLCAEMGVALIHISSGCIFNGPGKWTEHWTEEDEPNHHGQFYAHCKIEAERDVIAAKARAWLFRIRMPFSQTWSSRNWLVKLLDYPLVLDGLNSVTFLDEFCLRSYLIAKGDAEPGIYHAAYPTPVRTLEVAQLLRVRGLRRIPVVPYPPEDFVDFHVSRSQAILGAAKFEAAAGVPFGDPWAALRWCIDRLLESRSKSAP